MQVLLLLLLCNLCDHYKYYFKEGEEDPNPFEDLIDGKNGRYDSLNVFNLVMDDLNKLEKFDTKTTEMKPLALDLL